MAAFPVKYFHSAMRGAPTVSGTAGTMIGLLDACLINGFGTVTLTGLSASSGVATATVSSGNSFDVGAIVLIAGATPGALNGEARVLTSTATSFTFATSAADGAASGTITAKYAPVGGWDKIYSGTNKAVYQSTDLQANGHCLRLDDSGTNYSVVRGFEAMSDVDTGSGPFPTTAQVSDTNSRWWKYGSAGATATDWYFFGDSRFFFHAIAMYSVPANGLIYPMHPMGFGDSVALAPGGDAWSTGLAYVNATSNMATHGLSSGSSPSGTGGVYCARAITGLGAAAGCAKRPYMGAVNMASGSEDTFGAGVSPVDGKLLLSKMLLLNDSVNTAPPRAEIPGIYYLPHSGVFRPGLATGYVVEVDGALAGRRLIAVGAGGAYDSISINGGFLVDVTGPWR